MITDFRDRVAVITGGASGIGFAVARVLGRLGARLVLADIEAAALQAALRTLTAEGYEVAGRITDVGERADIDQLAELAWSRFGAVHFVMHNAGVAVFGAAQTLTDADWAWSLRVNLQGPINGVQAFLPRMLAQGQPGHMLFTASFAGLVPNKDLAAYNVSKAAVVALAESLHKDLRGTAISASVLCPMRVQSNIDRSMRNRPATFGGPSANRSYTEAERADLQGGTLPAGPVAEAVVAAVRRGDLYIHTHASAAGFIQARAERMLRGFTQLPFAVPGAD
jgi:NAD(P)-dependent dehydrogenase (short-subunit alcohol dehydrogenase family)